MIVASLERKPVEVFELRKHPYSDKEQARWYIVGWELAAHYHS
jgi:hypothetical protein